MSGIHGMNDVLPKLRIPRSSRRLQVGCRCALTSADRTLCSIAPALLHSASPSNVSSQIIFHCLKVSSKDYHYFHQATFDVSLAQSLQLHPFKSRRTPGRTAPPLDADDIQKDLAPVYENFYPFHHSPTTNYQNG